MQKYNFNKKYTHLNFPVEPEVEEGEDGEGDEGHAKEVGDQDVVPRVGDRHLQISLSGNQ